jgi:8-oxo-dGTP diphosphatase
MFDRQGLLSDWVNTVITLNALLQRVRLLRGVYERRCAAPMAHFQLTINRKLGMVKLQERLSSCLYTILWIRARPIHLADNPHMQHAPEPPPRFCRFCGVALVDDETQPTRRCPSAGCPGQRVLHEVGPRLMVLCFIFAEQHLLLLKRGTPPYAGFWAPPGGFVEAGESVETAAARETWEEVRVRIESRRLIPLAISSIPAINQVYVSYVARLDAMQTPQPCAPEALAARWFAEEAFPMSDIWAPSQGFDIRALFARLKSGRFEFYQRTEDYLRVIGESERITYLSGQSQDR